MKSKKRFPYLWATAYGVILTTLAAAVLLKTFVIKEAYVENIQDGGIYTQLKDVTTDESVSTSNSYKDDNISITINQKVVDNTTVYIADIQVSSVVYLRTALADDTYGRNIKDTTSDMAEANNAIFAINGDYYGFRDNGYVLRNGVLYRDTYEDADDEVFVLYSDGSCDVVKSGDASGQSLLDNGAVQILSFGPGLVENGAIAVDSEDEVDQHMTSNPRTAIGMISPLHYVMVVSDGRTDESEGLTLYELAQVMKDCGCTEAYNLDGGGSSTMWFNGEIINNPSSGNKSGEREVSDIVYIGKE